MHILLADDHAMVRSGLRRIVTEAYPDAVVVEVGSATELHQEVRKQNWSILVLDIALGEKNSLDMVPGLIELRPGLPIIVLSMYGERQFVVRALRAGVSAYLTKDQAPAELLRAMGSVLSGKRYLGQALAAELAEHVALVGLSDEALHEQLSPREYEVLLLLAAARSVSEIATQLDLSAKTVSTYRTRILEKMGMTSNAQLMRYALQHALVQ
ncbi:MAG: response regulator transcription factor [Planctomycetes bacterium]|nr:response regulator transcription factor [Planctomycetota bacterium]